MRRPRQAFGLISRAVLAPFGTSYAGGVVSWCGYHDFYHECPSFLAFA